MRYVIVMDTVDGNPEVKKERVRQILDTLVNSGGYESNHV